MNVITSFYFLISLVNERIQEKLNNVYEAIYDLPWYDYTVKQRKLFLMVLQCNQLKMDLRAGGLHLISVERFGTVVQNAYSTLLIIKNLLEMQN